MSSSLLISWLALMTEMKGSDLYLTVGAYPTIRSDAGFTHASDAILSSKDLDTLVSDLTTPEQVILFHTKLEFNMALDLKRLGRFRINLLKQRQNAAIVIRRITSEVPTMEGLGLPTLLGELVRERRGLVILVGATGSGKSTSLAAMIDHRNTYEVGHILTVEDPIEYVHEHKMSIVTQREIGTDTRSYNDALVNALRQKPDAILIGEIREQAVMRHALNITETGHLALATLHANNADQTIDRIANFFEPEERRQALLNLSFNLRGIVSQRLVRSVTGGRVLALEILLNTKAVQALIRNGDTSKLKDVMLAEEHLGMLTFDRSLEALLRSGAIAPEVALAECDNRVQMTKVVHDVAAENFENDLPTDFPTGAEANPVI
jgi:twitching motility protein PilU